MEEFPQVLHIIGTLIGRLLVRVILKEKGVSPEDIKLGITAEGKPYIVRRMILLTLIIHNGNYSAGQPAIESTDCI